MLCKLNNFRVLILSYINKNMVFGISLTFITKYENFCFTISLLSKAKMILKKKTIKDRH